MQSITFALPFPPSRNAGRRHAHWQTVHRQTAAYYALCARVCHDQALTLPTGWAALTARATCHVWALNDEDNLLARLKPTIDWVVRQRVVPDDSVRYWHWDAIPTQIVQRRTPAWIALTLTESPEHARQRRPPTEAAA